MQEISPPSFPTSVWWQPERLSDAPYFSLSEKQNIERFAFRVFMSEGIKRSKNQTNHDSKNSRLNARRGSDQMGEKQPSNWLEKALSIGFSPDIVKKSFRIQPIPAMNDRTITVDTNYLVQINPSDLISMLFDVGFENSVAGFKKQMARLFRDVIGRKIDLYLSDIVLSEFVGYAPKNKELAEIYRKYIGVISPSSSFQSCFFYLAAAINSCIVEMGQAGDLRDTYSYILSALAEIKYFVTGDRDVARVYNYLSRFREEGSDERIRQINKIKRTYHTLCGSDEISFPLDDILGFILASSSDLPVPVSIERLESSLPSVLDKVETILWIFRTLKEIDLLKSPNLKLPEEWNNEIVEQARARIANIASCLGLQNPHQVDPAYFHVKLVEEESNWKAESQDMNLATSLRDQLNIIWSCIHEEEELEYQTLEQRFLDEEFEKEVTVRCENCGKQIETVANYEGVVGGDSRDMGAELHHRWSSEFTCPSCGELIEVVFWVYEYPFFCVNYEDTECSNCKIVRTGKAVPQSPPTTDLTDFMPAKNDKRT